MEILENFTTGIKIMVDGIGNSLDTIAKVCDYLLNPTKIAIAAWHGLVTISIPLCMGITILAILMFAVGYKGWGKVAVVSTSTCIIIQAISAL